MTAPSASARRFAFRLRLSHRIRRFITTTDGSDVLTVVALAMLFVGLLAPSWAFGVIGALLVLLTPIGTALRILIRGR